MDLSSPSLLMRGLLTLVVTSLVFLVIALIGADPLSRASLQLLESFGTAGIAVGVLASDILAVPLPPSTFVAAAIAADHLIIPALLITCISTVIGATLAYWLGPYIGRLPLLHRLIEPHHQRATKLFEHHGVWAIGIAALTPLPFSIMCWLAGIYRMDYRRFFLATLIRIPRVLVYFLIFSLGWLAVA